MNKMFKSTIIEEKLIVLSTIKKPKDEWQILHKNTNHLFSWFHLFPLIPEDKLSFIRPQHSTFEKFNNMLLGKTARGEKAWYKGRNKRPVQPVGRGLRHVKRSSQGGVGAPVLHCSTFRQLISTINLFRLSINFQTFQFFLLILQISTSGEH